MSGNWTIKTAMEHWQHQHDDLVRLLQERYESQTKAIEAAFASQQNLTRSELLSQKEAILKAEVSVDKRLEAMNELRAQLTDQAATFMSRAEATAKFDAMTDKIDSLRLTRSSDQGRNKGLSDGWGVLIALITVVIAAGAFLATH